MLGVSQQRVSQFVKDGSLAVERDSEGRNRYDRISAEKLAARRAMKRAFDAGEADEKKALQAEARDRFRRQREREEAEERERDRRNDELKERSVVALELIAATLKRSER